MEALPGTRVVGVRQSTSRRSTARQAGQFTPCGSAGRCRGPCALLGATEAELAERPLPHTPSEEVPTPGPALNKNWWRIFRPERHLT